MQKESLRKKIDEAKKAIEIGLGKNNNPELTAAIQSLLVIVEIMIALFLEKKVRKNSSNSGLAPSRNDGSNGNRNKKGEERTAKLGNQIANTKLTTTKEIISVEKCKDCGQKLDNEKVISTEIRKRIDIVYEIVEHTMVGESKKCNHCGHINKPKFPDGVHGEVQYGQGIKATIINFLMVQMMSLERIQEHFHGLIGRVISQAVMLKYVMQLYEALEEWEKNQIVNILASPIIHGDETSLRVNKENQWIHSYSAGNITLLFLHPNRGIKAMDDIGIIPKYGGILIHDCWQSYLSYENKKHALCGGHLLRELKFIEDSTKYLWATKMKRLLRLSCYIVAKRKDTSILTDTEYEKLQSMYRKILEEGEQEMPPVPEKTGKKGRVARSDAQNLWSRLSKYEDSILMFAKIKEVEFTNNRAERDLRSSKTKQKVAGCFRTAEYAKYFCRITSYIKSMRYRGFSAFEAIGLALEGKIP